MTISGLRPVTLMLATLIVFMVIAGPINGIGYPLPVILDESQREYRRAHRGAAGSPAEKGCGRGPFMIGG